MVAIHPLYQPNFWRCNTVALNLIQNLVVSGGLTEGVAGERRRRASGGAAAGTRIPARTGAELVHVLHGQLHGGLGDVLRWLVGSGDERGAETVDGCPVATAGALAPVSRWLGQANK
jgi:hypothetical protein